MRKRGEMCAIWEIRELMGNKGLRSRGDEEHNSEGK